MPRNALARLGYVARVGPTHRRAPGGVQPCRHASELARSQPATIAAKRTPARRDVNSRTGEACRSKETSGLGQLVPRPV